MKGKWVVNLDCIGAGDDLVLVCNKFPRPKPSPWFGLWEKNRREAGLCPAFQEYAVMSDNANFSANGIMIGAFRKDRFG